MTKILFTTTLTFLIFSLFALPVSVEGKTYDEMLLKIRRNIEKIQSRMIEKPSHVTTLHPETDAEKVFLTGRVEELSGEGEVYFQWGPTEWMENKTEPQEITFRGRFAEKITGLDSRREPFFARAVLETEEGTFYGSTLSF